MVERVYLFSCDHSGCPVGWDVPVKFLSYEDARSAGWAISRGRTHVYCPKCAKKHRNTGCYGVCNWR